MSKLRTTVFVHHRGFEAGELRGASLHRPRRRPRGVARHIEIHEDQQYRWWWVLYDGECASTHGPYDTKHEAKDDVRAHESHVHVATIPWKLP